MVFPRVRTACSIVLLLLPVFNAVVKADSCVQGQPSTGTIQMVDMYGSCPPGDQNGIVSACGVAFDVSIDQHGVVSLTPLVQGSTNWTGPGPENTGVFDCRDMNATGLLKADKRSAHITLYNDRGGKPSLLHLVKDSKISLQVSKTYNYKAPVPECSYTYTVVKGCVLGISAPSSPPPCPKGTYVTKGVNDTPYCAPCPPGTFSRSENADTCRPCPKGTEKPYFGGKCTKCLPGMYSKTAGALRCEYCLQDNKYTNGQYCRPCPKDSWPSKDRSQCHACNAAKRCCRANPSKHCPPCAPGFNSGRTFSSMYALDAAFPSRCSRLSPAVCTTAFNITITPSCQLVWTANTTQNSNMAFCYSSPTESEVQRARLDTKRDFTGFTAYTDSSVLSANVTGIQSPYLNFTFPSLKCTYQYRAMSGLASKILGAYPLKCPYGTPGCPFKLPPNSRPLCPPGRYLQKRVCLPCPPGSFSASNSSKPCSTCPAGMFAQGYGNTKCKTCPPGTAAVEGSNECVKCLEGSYSGKGASDCSVCPPGTFSRQGWPYCLGNNAGTVCCGAGFRCRGAKCPETLPTGEIGYPSVLKLNSTTAKQALCKKAKFLTCLGKRGLVALSANNIPVGSSGNINIKLTPVAAPSCVLDRTLSHELSGIYLSSTTATAADSVGNVNYTLTAFTSDGRSFVNISMALGKKDRPELSACSSTFELVAGYAFDLLPPANTACPDSAVPVTAEQRTFCSFCDFGSRKKGSVCLDCGPGTFQNLFGTTGCRTCPAGSFGSGLGCDPCAAGSYSKKGWGKCKPCPSNTFSEAGARSCTKCKEGLVAPEGSPVCNVPVSP